MNNDLKMISSSDLPAKTTELNQTGDYNTQIAHAENVNNTINIVIPQLPIQNNVALCPHTCKINLDYYNLFVISDENFTTGHFVISKERALTESIDSELKMYYSTLSESAIADIKTFPALFASENHSFGKTDEEHLAYLGIISDIKIQDNGIKIYYQLFSSIPQQRLNELTQELSLKRASYINELNRTHWTIKKINLIEELKDAGIKVLFPA